MNIRFYEAKDNEDLVILFEDLGYPTTLEVLEKRFETLFQNPSYYLYVSEIEGKVVGMCGFSLMHAFEHDTPFTKIHILSTHHDYRRKGIGQALLDHVVAWGESKGSKAVTLNSGIREERYAAHRFYEHYGFRKAQYGFIYDIS